MHEFTDIKHFNSIFEKYHKKFVVFAYGYTRDWDISEDFVSEAFTIYWEKRLELNSNTNPPAYLLTIIKNKCLNHLQQKKIREKANQHLSELNEWKLSTQIATLEACDPTLIFSKEIESIIDKTIKKLPEKTQTVFIMSRFEHLSHKEIAEKLRISTKAVEFHIAKMTNVLRKTLKDYLVFFTLFCFFY